MTSKATCGTNHYSWRQLQPLPSSGSDLKLSTTRHILKGNRCMCSSVCSLTFPYLDGSAIWRCSTQIDERKKRKGGKEGFYDVAPPPLKKQRFSLTDVSWLLGTKKDAMTKLSSQNVLFARGLSNDDDVGGGKGHRISGDRYGRELVSNPVIWL